MPSQLRRRAIHAANGYLIDQFLRDGSNLRDDAHGGPIGNRIRLLREITRAVADAVGAERTGVRLSPGMETQGVRDSDPGPLSIAAAEVLSSIGIAHLELREAALDDGAGQAGPPPLVSMIRTAFKGPLILNTGYDAVSAQAMLDAGVSDAIAFGRPFIANPDLPRRLAEHRPLAQDSVATWYSQGPDGYVDYPGAAR